MTPTNDTAGRVYALAKEGRSKAEIARLLGKSPGTVSGHLSNLLSCGALRVAEQAPGKPTRYKRGARFAAWEASETAHPPCHGRGAGAGVVVHALSWRQAIHPEATLKAEPPAEFQALGNGTVKRSWVERFDTYEVTVQQTVGKQKASLVYRPGKVFVPVPEEKNPDQYVWAAEVRARAAWIRCREAYGFAYLGDLKPSNKAQKAEFAVSGFTYRGPKEEFRRVDGSWAGVDDTPHRGNVETNSPSVIEAFATGPERWAAQEEHNADVQVAQADLSAWVADLGERMAQEDVEFQRRFDAVSRALHLDRRHMGQLLELVHGLEARQREGTVFNLGVLEALLSKGDAPESPSTAPDHEPAAPSPPGHDVGVS